MEVSRIPVLWIVFTLIGTSLLSTSPEGPSLLPAHKVARLATENSQGQADIIPRFDRDPYESEVWTIEIDTVMETDIGYGSSLVLDSQGHRFLLFGGTMVHGGIMNDLLTLDFDKYTVSNIPVQGEKPEPLFIPSMAFDAKRNRAYIFGGWARDARKPSNAMYSLDARNSPASWQLISPKKEWPSARNGACMIADSVRNCLLLFSGDGGPGAVGFTPLDDFWRYDLLTARWEQLQTNGEHPPARWHAMMVAVERSRKAYLFGGAGLGDQEFDRRLFELDLESYRWSHIETSGDTPPSLQGGTLTYDPQYHALVLVGGLRHQPPGNATSSDVWVFDISRVTWHRLDGGLVLMRRDHIAGYDTATRRHILIGGTVSNKIGNFYERGNYVKTIIGFRLLRNV